ncbi:unnamed protein product [Sphagnum jensenii]|uniref:Uncharacterized protein n=1 Tax=Sphagnum jensenii TaxID=128206 RepID=A0ABP0VZC6_9BRYO
MDMPKIKLELETQQFEDTKAKAEDHGYRGATSSAGRHANPFAANFSSMRILKSDYVQYPEPTKGDRRFAAVIECNMLLRLTVFDM